MKSTGKQIASGSSLPESGQRGLTLIEILVALGILAAVAVTFLLSMTTSSKAVMVSQERVAVDSLTKSQMERIKSWEYDATNDPPDYQAAKLTDIPDGYDTDIDAVRLDPDEDGLDDDDGLQEITITVTHDGETAFTLVGYKVNQEE
ncbi:MAG: type II secretion system GspH family protein, partial [Dehalococcoidia bacterium]|nr:type II secretion system GspH family protein [Dehalococcoidia bacterium]